MMPTSGNESSGDEGAFRAGGPPGAETRPRPRPRAGSKLYLWTAASAAFCITVSIQFLYRPLSQVERGDPAIYEYIAQSILRGQVPYRDVIDPKGPGSMYLGAAAMWIGRHLGIGDILAVRFAYIILAGLLSVLTLLVADLYLSSRLAVGLAFLIPLMPTRYSLMVIQGTQPKLPMLLFGMAALVFIAYNRAFWAGFSSMLSCLCWQPGLMFAGVAFLMFSKYLTSWRDLRAVKVVVGAMAPLGMVLLYFQWRGGLADLWRWTFAYDYSVFMPAGLRSTGPAWRGIIDVMRDRVFYKDFVFVEIALIGLVLFGYERVSKKLRGRDWLASGDLYRDAVLMPPIIYFAFCMVNFQSYPDTIPFFPFIGIFGAWFFVEGARFIGSLGPIAKFAHRIRFAEVIPALATALILFIGVGRAASYRVEGRTLADQYREGEIIASYLAASDTIYVHGPAEVLVLLNRPNLNPYVGLDTGADDYIAAGLPGGFASLIDEMETSRPKIVGISRLQNVRHREELETWVSEHYIKLALPWLNSVYIRKGGN
jgi:hypothetical protein